MRVSISLIIVLTLAMSGCTGPGSFFSEEESEEVPFEYDLTIEDMWNDIPMNQTSTSDILNWTYEFSKSPRVTNLTEIGYSCLLYTSPSPRDLSTSRMPSSA